MGQWLNSIISDQLAGFIVGVVTAIPIEAHFIGAAIVAMLVLKWLGWPGMVAIGFGLGWVLGLKRVGVEIVQKPQPPVEDYERAIAPSKPKRPTLLDKIRDGLKKSTETKT